MGWNTIKNLSSSLFNNINEGDYMYLVHSYYAEKNNQSIATTDYDLEYASALKHNNFYLSGTMVNAVSSFEKNDFSKPPVFNAGLTYKEFDEVRLLKNLNQIKTVDFQGSTKHPALVHIDLWKKVGGWSEEFSPTGGDDTDFAFKLWNEDVRIFKGLGKSLAYHFGSIFEKPICS